MLTSADLGLRHAREAASPSSPPISKPVQSNGRSGAHRNDFDGVTGRREPDGNSEEHDRQGHVQLWQRGISLTVALEGAEKHDALRFPFDGISSPARLKM